MRQRLLLFFSFFFFFHLTYIADGPHHYHPACGHKGSSHLSPVHALQIFLSRCKFSTLTTRQPMVEFYCKLLLGHFGAFSYQWSNTGRTHVSRNSHSCIQRGNEPIATRDRPLELYSVLRMMHYGDTPPPQPRQLQVSLTLPTYTPVPGVIHTTKNTALLCP